MQKNVVLSYFEMAVVVSFRIEDTDIELWLKNLLTSPTKWFVCMHKYIHVCLLANNDDKDNGKTRVLIEPYLKTSVV